MTVQHPHAELSAFIDDALGPAARAAVDGHLAACAACRAHVAELRATASLVHALPDPLPSRSLVPRLAVPPWLAPLRTLMTLASGAAVFLFIASSLASNITFLASGSAATSARQADRDALGNAQAPVAAEGPKLVGPTPTGVPAPTAEAARAPSPAASPVDTRSGAGVVTTDDAKRLDQATAGPPAPGTAFSTADGLATPSQADRSPLLNPWLWLAVALLCGAIAIALNRRLRASV